MSGRLLFWYAIVVFCSRREHLCGNRCASRIVSWCTPMRRKLHWRLCANWQGRLTFMAITIWIMHAVRARGPCRNCRARQATIQRDEGLLCFCLQVSGCCRHPRSTFKTQPCFPAATIFLQNPGQNVEQNPRLHRKRKRDNDCINLKTSQKSPKLHTRRVLTEWYTNIWSSKSILNFIFHRRERKSSKRAQVLGHPCEHYLAKSTRTQQRCVLFCLFTNAPKRQ